MEEALADSHIRGPRSPRTRTVSSLKVNGGWYSQDISDRRRDRKTDRQSGPVGWSTEGRQTREKWPTHEVPNFITNISERPNNFESRAHVDWKLGLLSSKLHPLVVHNVSSSGVKIA